MTLREILNHCISADDFLSLNPTDALSLVVLIFLFLYSAGAVLTPLFLAVCQHFDQKRGDR